MWWVAERSGSDRHNRRKRIEDVDVKDMQKRKEKRLDLRPGRSSAVVESRPGTERLARAEGKEGKSESRTYVLQGGQRHCRGGSV